MSLSNPPIADRTHRLVAYLIDILPIIILLAGIGYFFFGFDEVLSEYFYNRRDIASRAEFILHRNRIRNLSFAIWVVYCIFAEASSYQGSLGKRIMGIKVVDYEGNPLTKRQSIIRNITKILSAGAILGGFFWILFDKKRQGWHDKTAKTLVIDR